MTFRSNLATILFTGLLIAQSTVSFARIPEPRFGNLRPEFTLDDLRPSSRECMKETSKNPFNGKEQSLNEFNYCLELNSSKNTIIQLRTGIKIHSNCVDRGFFQIANKKNLNKQDINQIIENCYKFNPGVNYKIILPKSQVEFTYRPPFR